MRGVIFVSLIFCWFAVALRADPYCCRGYEPPCYLPFDDQHRCASPTYAPWCQSCQSRYMCPYYYGYPGSGPYCVPYDSCQPNQPGRACPNPCGAPVPPTYGYGAPCGYGCGCGSGGCCPLDWWGCSRSCIPCQPAVRAYVGPRVSYLRIRSGALVATVNEGTGEITEAIETTRQNATMGGVQTGVWYRAAGKIFEQLEGYWEQGDPRNRQEIERNRTWERWEVTGRIGATAGVGCYCTVLGTPYAGYGFRRFKDEFRSEDVTIDTPGGPVEITLPEVSLYYSTYFVPLGGYLSLTLGNCIEVGVFAEYQTPVQSRLKVQVDVEDLGVVSACNWRVPRKAAWLVEVPIRARLGPCCVQLDVSLIPYYKDTRYGGVEITGLQQIIPDVDDVLIPDRRQITAGLRLELGLRI